MTIPITNFAVASGGLFLGVTASGGGSVDVKLFRDAANTLALQNGTNAQTFNVYNTYSGAGANYERGFVSWSKNANRLSIGMDAAGTGANRAVDFFGSDFNFKSNTLSTTWLINTSGHFITGTDNTYDIGASGATRPRRIYVGTGVTVPGGAAFITTSTALTDGAAAQVATITNGPTAGNPTKWIGINDNGTTRYIPAW